MRSTLFLRRASVMTSVISQKMCSKIQKMCVQHWQHNRIPGLAFVGAGFIKNADDANIIVHRLHHWPKHPFRTQHLWLLQSHQMWNSNLLVVSQISWGELEVTEAVCPQQIFLSHWHLSLCKHSLTGTFCHVSTVSLTPLFESALSHQLAPFLNQHCLTGTLCDMHACTHPHPHSSKQTKLS